MDFFDELKIKHRGVLKTRHSVREYIDSPIEPEVLNRIRDLIEKYNEKSGLNIQLVENEPIAFSKGLSKYGKFSGISNYIVMVGKKSKYLQEVCGYYGEIIVLEAQRLGLNTCWVGLTYKKVPEAFKVGSDEKLAVVISLGYGKTQGTKRKSKSAEEVSNIDENSPDWFRDGVIASLYAPTAVNQQKFKFNLVGDKVEAKSGLGFYAKMDLGIAKYHFEVGSGKGREIWV